MREITSPYWFTFKGATNLANRKTKQYECYFTAIKSTHARLTSYGNEKECWAVTNKYDPRVRGVNNDLK